MSRERVGLTLLGVVIVSAMVLLVVGAAPITGAPVLLLAFVAARLLSPE